MLNRTYTLVRNTNSVVKAFSLIEVLIGLFIIGLVASMVMPRLLRRSPTTEWSALQHELNTLLFFARQEAIVTQKVHRLMFNEKARTITVEVPEGEEKLGVPNYVQVYSTYFTTHYVLPESVHIGRVKLGKKNLFEEHKGRAWCYVVPNGLIQDVSVQLVRDEASGIASKVFQTAPFLGTFDEVEGA